VSLGVKRFVGEKAIGGKRKLNAVGMLWGEDGKTLLLWT